jgi:hypothetical protein
LIDEVAAAPEDVEHRRKVAVDPDAAQVLAGRGAGLPGERDRAGALPDLLLGERRGAREPSDQAAFLVGEYQQRRTDRARGIGLLECVDHCLDLRPPADVRAEEDDPRGLAESDLPQERGRRRQTRIGVHDPLSGELREREARGERAASGRVPATRSV